MAKKKDAPIISLSTASIAERTGIPYMKIRNNILGNYHSLSPEEKTQIVNAVHDEITPFLKKLGYVIPKIIKIKEED